MFKFSYALTRPYPYSWFPWVTAIGGVILIVLFSVINVAAVGYELELQGTTQPNDTLRHHVWMERAPFSWLDKTKASCQPQSLAVQSQFFTNNSGFTYTIQRIYQFDNEGLESVLPSVTYLNNALEFCNVTAITMEITSTGRTADQTELYPWGIVATGYLTCRLNNDEGVTYLDLIVSYDLFSDVPANQKLLELNRTSRASLWWGQSLVSYGYVNLANAIYDESSSRYYDVTGTNNTLRFSGARFDFVPFLDGQPPTSNLTSIRHSANEGFRVLCYESDSTGALVAANSYPPNFCLGLDTRLTDQEIAEYPWWQAAHDYGQALLSTFYADLGNNQWDNLLTSPEYLQYYSNRFRSIEVALALVVPYNRSLPSNETYLELKDTFGALDITPAVIYTQYFCQLPRQKSAGTLFINVLVADLVFLQAVWAIFTLTTTMWLGRANPNAMECKGCLELRRQWDEIAQEIRSSMHAPQFQPMQSAPAIGTIGSRPEKSPLLAHSHQM